LKPRGRLGAWAARRLRSDRVSAAAGRAGASGGAIGAPLAGAGDAFGESLCLGKGPESRVSGALSGASGAAWGHVEADFGSFSLFFKGLVRTGRASRQQKRWRKGVAAGRLL